MMIRQIRDRGVRSSVLAAAGALLALAVAPPANAAAPQTSSAPPNCSAPALPRSAFPARPAVDNRFFPLVPGTQWTLQGTVGGSRHKVVTTVTDLTKTVDGVTTVVVRDEDFDGDTLQEAELALFAQDAQGTVWALGEYPELYDNGHLTGAPDTWAAGLDGATAGIAMAAAPRTGTAPYAQGDAPAVDFKDCAQVVAADRQTTVPAGSFSHVLVTDEWAPADPAGGHQSKSYAPGVGLIKATPSGGDSPETLSLAKVVTLSPDDLAQVHQAALAQDARGDTVSPDVWGRTPPAT